MHFPLSLSLLPLLATHILALPVGAASTTSSSTPLTAKELDSHLTPDTFAPTVAQGLWFVEHYSPYCGHCRHFRPTWEQLVVDAHEGVGAGGVGNGNGNGGEELKEVKMGSVDCAVHGDLCDANNIKGYPTLLMFHDGKMVDQFKGARELDDLKAFMRRHVVAARAESGGEKGGEKGGEDKQAVESVPAGGAGAETKAPPKNDHPPTPPNTTPPPNSNPPPNPSGEVLSIPPHTFPSTLTALTSAGHPVFVKFFAPWCGHCKKLAPAWKALAKHMRGKVVVAEVDCEGAGGKEVCAAEGVGGYPTLVWYPGDAGGGGGDGEGGEMKVKPKGMEYGQGRKLDQLKAFAEKASAAGVLAIGGVEELEGWVKKEDVVYILLHDARDEGIVKKIRTASSPLLGSPQILSSSSPALFAKYSLTPLPSSSAKADMQWKLLAFKDHDTVFPSSILHSTPSPSSSSHIKEQKPKTMEEAQHWMLTHRLPTTLELTRDTFQSVMNAPQKPVVVLAFSPAGEGERVKERVLERLGDVGRKWRVRTRRGGGEGGDWGLYQGQGVNRGEEGNVNGNGNGMQPGDEGMYKGREVVFAWMDEGRWGDWIKSMYGGLSRLSESEGGSEGGEVTGLEGVKVVIADHSTLTYYPTDAQSHPIRFTSSAAIFAAVEDAISGRSAAVHSEGVVERVARYLNAKMQSLEASVTSHPFRSVLILLGVLGAVFWMLTRFVGDGSGGNGSGRGAYERGREEWREVKGRSGRLD